MADTLRLGYLLSKKEKRLGTPEKPLSDLGLVTYRTYWAISIFRYLLKVPALEQSSLTIDEICTATSIVPDEVYYMLKTWDLVEGVQEGTYEDSLSGTPRPKASNPAWHGNQHTRRKQIEDSARAVTEASITIPDAYRINFEKRSVMEQYLQKYDSKGYLTLKVDKLQWTPFLVTRGAQPPDMAEEVVEALHTEMHRESRSPVRQLAALPPPQGESKVSINGDLLEQYAEGEAEDLSEEPAPDTGAQTLKRAPSM